MGTSPLLSIAATPATIRKNNEVRASLAANGDNGAAVRNVTHFLYPEYFPDTKKERIASRMKSLGFAVSSNGDHGINVEGNSKVASADFDNLTEALEQMMKNEGWQYDGWECSIVRS